MKLYFLRHELRPLNDSTFLTELFDIGKENSEKKIKPILDSLNIDKIYCSPFIRVLQTIHPFAKKHNIQPSCDYCLAETVTEKNFIVKPDMTLSENQTKEFNVNKFHESLFDKKKLVYPESDKQIEERVNIFCKYLEERYGPSNTTILIASHMDIVNLCLGYFSKQNINRHKYYAMGKISTVENNKIVFLNDGSELDDEVELSSL